MMEEKELVMMSQSLKDLLDRREEPAEKPLDTEKLNREALNVAFSMPDRTESEQVNYLLEHWHFVPVPTEEQAHAALKNALRTF